MPETILITGGTRSGKSQFALSLAHPPRLFVATATARDREMRERINRHQAERGKEWDLLESPLLSPEELDRSLSYKSYQWVVLDCITLLVSNLILKGVSRISTLERVAGLLKVFDKHGANLVCVTSEVGMGLVPDYPLARIYRDLLGEVNKLIAASSTGVYLMVAGIPVKVK